MQCMILVGIHGGSWRGGGGDRLQHTGQVNEVYLEIWIFPLIVISPLDQDDERDKAASPTIYNNFNPWDLIRGEGMT